MIFLYHYDSPIGDITLASRGRELIGLWLDGQRFFADSISEDCEEKELPIFLQTKNWLDIYFSGNAPDFIPPLSFEGISEFRRKVWEIMLEIPFGEVLTYGQIAKQIESSTGKRVSSQAVGGAVSHNSISIIIPCHRVVGANRNLTGYAGGLDKKIRLLQLEGLDMKKFHSPRNSGN